MHAFIFYTFFILHIILLRVNKQTCLALVLVQTCSAHRTGRSCLGPIGETCAMKRMCATGHGPRVCSFIQANAAFVVFVYEIE